MGSDWQEYKLADLCDSIDYGFTTSAKDEPVGPKFLRITDIVTGHIDWNDVPYCESDQANTKQYLIHDKDIVVARTGANTGSSVFVSSPPEAVFASYLVRLKISDKANSRFISYFLKSPEFWAYMQGVLGDKSAQPNASAKTMTQVKLKLPPNNDQQAISHILGSLDDKIELNRRMNETLEATARAIFKSWFVDFDPVRAKAEGGDPGLPNDIAALFPDSFENSELGEIPTGWEIGKLQDILILQRGFDLPKKKRSPGRYPLIAASGQDGFHNEYKVSGPGVATGRSGKLGIVTFVHSHFWPLNTTLWVKAYKNSNSYHAYFLLQTLNLEAYNAGSAVPTLNRNHIHNLKLPVPNDSVLKCFELHSRELFFAIDKNTEQMAHLSQIRDTLLPKLISGELPVPDAEKFVEEAGI